MQAANVPAKFPIPFAASAGAGFIRPIPQASQIGVQGGAASLTTGFPPLTFQPVSAGGVPPWGADFNGILNQITLWSQWQNAGGTVIYDGTFSTAIGGYPKGAILASAATAGLLWISTADNNITDPDSGGAANWLSFISGASSRVITASSGPTLTISPSDANVFVKQAAPGAITLLLPATPVPQQVSILDDLGDADVNNITISGNGNQINNLAAFTLSQPFMCATLIWRAGATQWRLKGTSL